MSVGLKHVAHVLYRIFLIFQLGGEGMGDKTTDEKTTAGTRSWFPMKGAKGGRRSGKTEGIVGWRCRVGAE